MEVKIDRPADGAGPSAGQLSLLAGRTSLDFANTISGAGTPFEIDHLTDVDAMTAWLRHAGLCEVECGEKAARPGPAPLQAALNLRSTINRIGSAVVGGHDASQSDLAALRQVAAEGLPGLRLARGVANHYVWQESEAPSYAAILAWLALDAIDILRFDDLSRLRRCPGEDCGWLFLDTSKNGKRRWCDMNVCGNRAKARRHRARFSCTAVS